MRALGGDKPKLAAGWDSGVISPGHGASIVEDGGEIPGHPPYFSATAAAMRNSLTSKVPGLRVPVSAQCGQISAASFKRRIALDNPVE